MGMIIITLTSGVLRELNGQRRGRMLAWCVEHSTGIHDIDNNDNDKESSTTY